ncbi:MAG: ATP-binding cassette domain-containing protein [Rhodobacteraceae bacterium]|nr:ATP-binding cassette domain-containing protein [Paracoccaceae bacterium]
MTDPTPSPPLLAQYNWLKRFIDPLRSLYREVFAVSFFVNLLAVSAPVFVLQVYDRVVYQRGIATLIGLSFGMIIVVCFDFILRQTRAKLMQRAALEIDVVVGKRLFAKVLNLPLRTLETRPATFWQLMFRDLETVRNTLSGPSAVLITDLPFAILFLGVIFIIAWPLAWVMIFIFMIFLILAFRSGQVVTSAADSERSKALARDAIMGELLHGRATIKALALQERVRTLWEERQADTISHSMSRGSKSDAYVTAAQSLTTITTITMTAVGSLAIMEHELTIGALIASNMLSGRILGPFNQLVGAWRGYGAFKQSINRLGNLFAETEDIAESAIKLPRPKGRVTLESVSFKYAENAAPVIDNVNIDIQAGGLTAIMGRNGSGKTTLLKIILGLYRPATGRVLMDNADIAQFARPDLAKWIGYVPQECILFDGSIRTNIAYGRPDVADEEIVRAATLSQAHPLIVDLPQGYGTPVGEAGGKLSSGLRQRIAIARAFVGDPPVVALDEPTSSLDRQAEASLRDALVELGKTHTVLMVTHSPVLLQACSNIILMEAGRIRAAGPAAKVLDFIASQRPPASGGAVPLQAAKAAQSK